MKKIVFVDRDGTIVREPADKQVDSLDKLEFISGIISGLKLLVDSGFTLVMVSNQDGLGTRNYPMLSFRKVQAKIINLLAGEEIRFERVFICPHPSQDNCRCRKPKIGLVKKYLERHKPDVERSFVLGDRETDVLFARHLGVRSVRLTGAKASQATYVTRNAFDACNFIARSARAAFTRRTTAETDIKVQLSLDGVGKYEIATGIGFLDHMLAQVARHAQIDLTLRADGDLNVDEHHTVEDIGIALGEGIRKALGDKRGIERYGFVAPMDEALAQVSIDLSGRSFLSFNCTFRRERVGRLPTELVEDFFRGFADGLKATLHISCRGRNDHHKIEAIFKSVSRALRSAIRVDARSRRMLPSTKEKL